jgi:hypothetical protein
MEGCYPCSVYGHACTMGDVRKKRAAVVCLPLHGWFDVALWVRWPGALFPAYIGEVQASSAYEAIEQVMRTYRLRSVPYAAAIAEDGSLIYRVHRVRL